MAHDDMLGMSPSSLIARDVPVTATSAASSSSTRECFNSLILHYIPLFHSLTLPRPPVNVISQYSSIQPPRLGYSFTAFSVCSRIHSRVTVADDTLFCLTQRCPSLCVVLWNRNRIEFEALRGQVAGHSPLAEPSRPIDLLKPISSVI